MASTMAGRPLVAVRLLPMNRMRVPSARSGDATPAQAIDTAAATTIAWGKRTSTLQDYTAIPLVRVAV